MYSKMTSKRELDFTNRLNMISRLREEICWCDRELYAHKDNVVTMFAIVRQKRLAQKKLEALQFSMR